MAIRFSGSGQRYTASLGLGVRTSLTVACWIKISVDRNTRVVPWVIHNGASNYLSLELTSAGELGVYTENTTPPVALTPDVGDWLYVAVTVDASNVRMTYETTPFSGSFSSSFWGISHSTNAASLSIGEWVSGTSAWLNGCVCGLKIWTATLTADELETEATQYAPVRTSGLAAYYRFDGPSTTDDSGNGRTLSGGAGVTQEPDPDDVTVVTPADSAAAADALTAAATVTLAEAAAASTGVAVAAGLGVADSGTAAESLTITATVPLLDTGTVTEVMSSGMPVPVADAGTGADAFATGATVVLTETATGADALSITAAVPLADSAVAADAVERAQLVGKALADAAAGLDALAVQSYIVREIGDPGPPRTAWPVRTPRRAWSAAGPRRRWSVRPPRTDVPLEV
ncbi:hypothetical protein DP939_02575 [Spongiactinospora rosea]|uniref:Concanavalin A-like lectin/glucanase superfamily protein n=1 Tax=Spongiactinospora rosea TaxID=2248750 RepID=A0A366M7N6_9ACTN|nr:LamG-like jellyroll fold domain-containing protein [Spongiactinospora rosea]RBQ21614.1 hypothetical protein DP939_02575 [Spongiactinospora rosea]